MQNTQKKKRSRVAILVAFLVIVTNLAVFGASAGYEAYVEDSIPVPAFSDINQNSDHQAFLYRIMRYASVAYTSFDTSLHWQIEGQAPYYLVADYVGSIVIFSSDRGGEPYYGLEQEFPALGHFFRITYDGEYFQVWQHTGTANPTYEFAFPLLVDDNFYCFPALTSDAPMTVVSDQDRWDILSDIYDRYGSNPMIYIGSSNCGFQYRSIVGEELERLAKDEGYDEGYAKGYEDFGESPNTLLEFIAAIFSAPGYLINTIFDFEIFGINMANAFRVILTLAIVGLVVMFAIKHGGA